MFSQFSLFNKSVLGMVLLSSSLAFAGGDGGAFNGPDLKGISIPVQLDRGISGAAMKAATSTCLVRGDAKSGIVPLMARIHKQIYPKGSYPSQGNSKHYLYESSGIDTIQNKVITSVSYTNSPIWGGEYLKTDTSRPDRKGYLALRAQVFEAFGSAAGVEGEVSLELNVGFLPYITYQNVDPDSGFDEFGRIQQDTLILNGVSIVVPDGYKKPVVMKNTITHAKTKISVNLAEYAECLQSQVQKNAAQE